MPKNAKQASGVFPYVAFVDQPAITRATGNYPDGICSDTKVSDYFKQ